MRIRLEMCSLRLISFLSAYRVGSMAGCPIGSNSTEMFTGTTFTASSMNSDIWRRRSTMTMRQTRRDSIVGGRSIARSGSVRSAVRLLPICSQRRPGREAGRKNSLNLLGNLEPEFLGLRDLADPGAFSRPSTIRPPTSAALSISAVLAENVHASQVEMPSGFQLMAVVRVDLLKAMLLGA